MSHSGVAYCRVLGPARLTINGAEAPPEILWRKHLALLVYLARSPRRGRTREHLLGLLWSDRDERQARHSLSEALRVMRRTLGDEAVQVDVDQVRLAADAVTLDSDVLADRYARRDWAGAAALVEGEFLEGLSIPESNEFETWVAAERALWRSQGLDALLKQAEAQLGAGDALGATHAARRALAIDPSAEVAARALLRTLALAGDRAGALRLADDFARTLEQQLGTTPGPETVRLVDRIREASIGRRALSAPPAARPHPPLLGRAAELGALTDAWARARGGRGQVVLVEGEPGEGKSRLIDELVARARLDDATVAWARAVPGDRDAAWSGANGLMAGGLADAPGLAGASPAALAALGVSRADTAAHGSDDALPRAEAFSQAVRASAEERPVLLTLDDAQWIDDETLALLPALARDVERRPAMLVLGVDRGAPGRTELDHLRSRIGSDLEGCAIRLGRLDQAALRALVAWALPQYAPDEADRVVRRVARDSDGIALLAVALVEAVVAGFKPAPDAHTWPSPQRTLVDSLPGDLPPAVIGSVCLRFRALPPAAQQVLAAAAAIGERVESAALARATQLAAPVVTEALDLLEWERWLTVDSRGYAFAAPIVRAVLLQEMISPGQARRYREGLPA
jgi:DNA-binding SARP family transcriptional activator